MNLHQMSKIEIPYLNEFISLIFLIHFLSKDDFLSKYSDIKFNNHFKYI